MIGYIYKTTNLVNNKVYIGQHKALEKDNSYLGSGKILKQAIQKYGKGNFTNEILEWCENQDELDSKEIYYIKLYKDKGCELYNIAKGGQGISKELASTLAFRRWENTSDEKRKHCMDKARAKQKELREQGLYKVKYCSECGSPVNSHKKTCSRFKRNYSVCEECGAKQGHFSTCSQFVKRVVTEETKEKQRQIALARDDEQNKRTSETLKKKWASGEMETLTCPECGGRSSNHKKGCSKYKGCLECGGKSGSHKKTCSKYKPPKEFFCELCNRTIRGEGNFRQHLKSKAHQIKLNK